MDGAFANPIHWIFAIAIFVLVFGPSKLGDIGGALGKSVKDFKSSVNDPDAKPAESGSAVTTTTREEPVSASAAAPSGPAPTESRPGLPDYRP